MPRIAYNRTAHRNRVLPRADFVSVGEGGEGALVQAYPGGRKFRERSPNGVKRQPVLGRCWHQKPLPVRRDIPEQHARRRLK
jgi:hypothetical protein